MNVSQTPFLSEIAADHFGPEIPSPKRAYFQQRLENRIFGFLLEKFMEAQKNGLTKAILARRIGKSPEVITRWLGAPSNLTLDTISDLLLAISAEELEPGTSSPLRPVKNDDPRFSDLAPRKKSKSVKHAATKAGRKRVIVDAVRVSKAAVAIARPAATRKRKIAKK